MQNLLSEYAGRLSVLNFCFIFYHTSFSVSFQGMGYIFKEKYRIFFDKKTVCNARFVAVSHAVSCLHFSVDEESQNDADDACNREADSNGELQGKYAQIQYKGRGQPEAAAVIQPAQSGNAAQCIADKAAQYNSGKHQQKQYPYIL